MTIKFGLAVSLIAGSLGLASDAGAQSANIDGAWSNSAKTCDKVFEKKDGRVSIRKDSDVYGNGLIIDGNRIIGKMATCNVKARKQQGDTVHLVTTCATTVAFEHVPITLKVVTADKITQIFPGVDGIEVTYERCKL
jgi:hypothetical protein